MARGLRIAGHPVHPMIIPFPIVLYTLAVVGDIVYLATGSDFWYRLGFVGMGLGIVTALVAAATGFAEYLTIPRRIQAKRMATAHALVLVGATGLMLVSLIFRATAQGVAFPETPLTGAPLGGAVSLNLAAFGLLLVGGWYGGHLVYVHGVGLTEEAAESRRVTQARVPMRIVRPHEPAPPPSQDEAH